MDDVVDGGGAESWNIVAGIYAGDCNVYCDCGLNGTSPSKSDKSKFAYDVKSAKIPPVAGTVCGVWK